MGSFQNHQIPDLYVVHETPIEMSISAVGGIIINLSIFKVIAVRARANKYNPKFQKYVRVFSVTIAIGDLPNVHFVIPKINTLKQILIYQGRYLAIYFGLLIFCFCALSVVFAVGG